MSVMLISVMFIPENIQPSVNFNYGPYIKLYSFFKGILQQSVGLIYKYIRSISVEAFCRLFQTTVY